MFHFDDVIASILISAIIGVPLFVHTYRACRCQTTISATGTIIDVLSKRSRIGRASEQTGLSLITIGMMWLIISFTLRVYRGS